MKRGHRQDVHREPWRADEVLGAGTYGEVRVFRHAASGVDAAVKRGRKRITQEGGLKLWLNEVSMNQYVGGSNHVLGAIDAFTAGGRTFLVMRVWGESLFRVMAAQQTDKLSPADVRTLMKQLLSAVAFLHSREVAHTDVKPCSEGEE